MKRWLCLSLVVCLLLAMTGCASQGVTSDPESSPAASDAGGQELPAPVSGIYKGQTITLSYQAVTQHIWPYDLPVINFLNGVAVFHDYGTVEGEYTELYGYVDTLNAVDTNGNVLFDEPLAELSNFNKDGIASAKTLSGEQIYVNKAGEKIQLSEAYTPPEDPTDSAHPAYDTLFKGNFEMRGDAYDPPIRLYDAQGNRIGNEEFQNIGNFYNGLAPFLQDGKLGLLGDDGRIVISATYETDNSLLQILFWEDHIVAEYDGHLAVLKVTRS